MKTTARRFASLLVLLVLAGFIVYAQRTVATARSENPRLTWRAALTAAFSGGKTAPGKDVRPNPTTASHTASSAAAAARAGTEPAVEPAQAGGSYEIAKSVIAGGGAMSSGGSYSQTGTIGQSVTGGSSGGAFSVAGGFWQNGACAAPTISMQPTGQMICSGMAASLAVSATGTGLTYQWRKGGVPLVNGGNIAGATSDTLTINPAATGDTGSYDVLITGACGSLPSNPAILAVDVFPLVPNSQSFAANGGTGSFAVTGVGSCGWTAISNAPWIMITGGGSGPGSGTVSFSVAGHTNLTPRSGTITINGGLTFTVLQGAAFLDVPLDHPFYTFIGKMSARGITSGCGSGNYCPESNVTREQMAIFIERALGVFTPPPGPATPTFADVPNSGATDFSHEFIEDFVLRGITAGCAAGPPRLYCPTANVTREQMAIFVMRALGVFTPPPGPTTPTFQDVPNSGPTDFSYEFIEEFVARGITSGCAAGPPRLYCPAASVTRGQMAVFLVRAFNL